MPYAPGQNAFQHAKGSLIRIHKLRRTTAEAENVQMKQKSKANAE